MEYLTGQEIAKLLKVVYDQNRNHHLAILLAVATGARTSQSSGLHWRHR